MANDSGPTPEIVGAGMAVGVFDSGLGGLTVLDAYMQALAMAKSLV